MAPLGRLLGQGRSAEVYQADAGTVVKLFLAGFPRELAERETRATEVASASGVAAPEYRGTVEVDGRYGIVLERVEGPTMMTLLVTRPWSMPRWASRLGELHARMHRHPGADLEPQRDLLARQIERAPGITQRCRTMALDRLVRLPQGDRLCHGDYHPDNVIVAAGGPVVIDWMAAVRGDPAADAARTSLLLSIGAPLPGMPAPQRHVIRLGRRAFHDLYLRRYLRLSTASARDVAAWRLPVAAARLAEDIDEERDAVLTAVERAAAT